MNQAIAIGLDLVNNIFQVHGVDAGGAISTRRSTPGAERYTLDGVRYCGPLVQRMKRRRSRR